jgi:4'-phosphopantetheinyl transferase
MTLEVEAARQVVDSADREAAARRQRPDDARRTLAGRVALRLLVAVRLGVPVSLASQIVVDRTCSTCHLPHGRPRVAGLSVSTSSSEERVLVAVAEEGTEVGVDIERVPPTVFDGFDDFVLHPDERERFGPVTRGASGTAARLSCWVEKEAVLKAVGVGLASPPHELLLATRPDDAVLPTRADMIGAWEWRLVEQAGVAEALGLSVTELPTEPGYRSAIAARVPARIQAVDIDSMTTQIASSEGLRV